MTQVTNGLRSILSHPGVYSAFQTLMGAHKARSKFVNEFIKPYRGMRILDIGCGTADILNYLTDVEYYGFDISKAYIARANTRFNGRGLFYCKELCPDELENLPSFDVVLALGLLHHLDNHAAANMLKMASQALKPDGRLITVDPCLEPGQNPLARFLIKQDRGQNVRTKSEYIHLTNAIFKSCHVQVRHQKWIPYTHCFMECVTN